MESVRDGQIGIKELSLKGTCVLQGHAEFEPVVTGWLLEV